MPDLKSAMRFYQDGVLMLHCLNIFRKLNVLMSLINGLLVSAINCHRFATGKTMFYIELYLLSTTDTLEKYMITCISNIVRTLRASAVVLDVREIK